jgi:hypothetical protein
MSGEVKLRTAMVLASMLLGLANHSKSNPIAQSRGKLRHRFR